MCGNAADVSSEAIRDMLELQLERTVLKGRRAFTIMSIKVDNKEEDQVAIMTPDGDLRFQVGDTWYAKDFARTYQDLVASSKNWMGGDTIILNNLPY